MKLEDFEFFWKEPKDKEENPSIAHIVEYTKIEKNPSGEYSKECYAYCGEKQSVWYYIINDCKVQNFGRIQDIIKFNDKLIICHECLTSKKQFLKKQFKNNSG